ncbi:alpha/beta hydrolase [Dolichospermum lemmermannii CS-548]|uniref:alpha/beta hydrolase n=1 Tax=Dolichospermum lemmermannii TaxID=54295 RepID=UPI00232BFBA8|nr:alpha/beta hydrolase [Dolichospermum lemmermannii]MDB9437230.1 alpha/beta hydrolase [Dolichospermum lemmermannii CS-548]
MTNHQSPITNDQSPITNHQSPITNHQSPITHTPKLCQLTQEFPAKPSDIP